MTAMPWDLSEAQVAQFRAEGRRPAGALPDARGRSWPGTTSSAVQCPSLPSMLLYFVLVRGTGETLYTLTNPVDDAMMASPTCCAARTCCPRARPARSSSTEPWRRTGSDGRARRSGTCPTSWARATRSFSKRDPESSLNHYSGGGFTPEGLLDYLALLGWSMGRTASSSARSRWRRRSASRRVSAQPARFDLKKCTAIMDWIGGVHRRNSRGACRRCWSSGNPDRVGRRVGHRHDRGGWNRWSRSAWRPCPRQPGMLGFLFTPQSDFTGTDDAARMLGPDSAPVLLRAGSTGGPGELGR